MILKVQARKKLEAFSLKVDLEFGSELTVILGPSGSGKTTLLNLIAGLMEPEEGIISFNDTIYFRHQKDDKKLSLPSYKRNIGYVFQRPSLFPHLSVKENILYGKGIGNSRKEEMEKWVELLRIEDILDKKPGMISGGQAQRVALARALLIHPSVLLLDEPFSALDNLIRRKVREDLLRVHQEYPGPILFVTHDLNEAFSLAEEIVIIENGEVLQKGERDEVFFKPKNRKTARFVGMRNIFEGVVKDILEEKMLVSTAKLDLHVPLRAEAKKGDSISFGIRPEDVLLIRPEKDNFKDKENVFAAKVVAVFPEELYYRLLLKLSEDSYDLEMLLPRHLVEKRLLAEGSNCLVSLPKKAICCLEKER